MNKISVFANFYIDSEERFLRLKDSFLSFHKANFDSWHINIRGEYKHQVEQFLKNNIKENLMTYFIETDEGWMEDSKTIIKSLRSFLVFIWVEDHICLKSEKKLNNIIDEMYDNQVDNLIYSWFHNGRYKGPLNFLEYQNLKNFSIFESNKKNCEIITSNISNLYYPISQVSIMSLNFFKENLEISKNKIRYNHKIPNNFEKKFNEIENMNFRNAVLHDELFVSIDDDHVCKNSSLISRGLYPNRKSREDMINLRGNVYNLNEKFNYKNLIGFFNSKIKKIYKKYFN
jgi:hypothetical protein